MLFTFIHGVFLNIYHHFELANLLKDYYTESQIKDGTTLRQLKLDELRVDAYGSDWEIQCIQETWENPEKSDHAYYSQGMMNGALIKTLVKEVNFPDSPLRGDKELFEDVFLQMREIAFAYRNYEKQLCAFYLRYRADKPHIWYGGLIKNCNKKLEEKDVIFMASLDPAMGHLLPIKDQTGITLCTTGQFDKTNVFNNKSTLAVNVNNHDVAMLISSLFTEDGKVAPHAQYISPFFRKILTTSSTEEHSYSTNLEKFSDLVKFIKKNPDTDTISFLFNKNFIGVDFDFNCIKNDLDIATVYDVSRACKLLDKFSETHDIIKEFLNAKDALIATIVNQKNRSAHINVYLYLRFQQLEATYQTLSEQEILFINKLIKAKWMQNGEQGISLIRNFLSRLDMIRGADHAGNDDQLMEHIKSLAEMYKEIGGDFNKFWQLVILSGDKKGIDEKIIIYNLLKLQNLEGKYAQLSNNDLVFLYEILVKEFKGDHLDKFNQIFAYFIKLIEKGIPQQIVYRIIKKLAKISMGEEAKSAIEKINKILFSEDYQQQLAQLDPKKIDSYLAIEGLVNHINVFKEYNEDVRFLDILLDDINFDKDLDTVPLLTRILINLKKQFAKDVVHEILTLLILLSKKNGLDFSKDNIDDCFLLLPEKNKSLLQDKENRLAYLNVIIFLNHFQLTNHLSELSKETIIVLDELIALNQIPNNKKKIEQIISVIKDNNNKSQKCRLLLQEISALKQETISEFLDLIDPNSLEEIEIGLIFAEQEKKSLKISDINQKPNFSRPWFNQLKGWYADKKLEHIKLAVFLQHFGDFYNKINKLENEEVAFLNSIINQNLLTKKDHIEGLIRLLTNRRRDLSLPNLQKLIETKLTKEKNLGQELFDLKLIHNNEDIRIINHLIKKNFPINSDHVVVKKTQETYQNLQKKCQYYGLNLNLTRSYKLDDQLEQNRLLINFVLCQTDLDIAKLNSITSLKDLRSTDVSTVQNKLPQEYIDRYNFIAQFQTLKMQKEQIEFLMENSPEGQHYFKAVKQIDIHCQKLKAYLEKNDQTKFAAFKTLEQRYRKDLYEYLYRYLAIHNKPFDKAQLLKEIEQIEKPLFAVLDRDRHPILRSMLFVITNMVTMTVTLCLPNLYHLKKSTSFFFYDTTHSSEEVKTFGVDLTDQIISNKKN